METIDLKTPRPIPENIEEWSDEIENLLSEWGEVALCYQYLHNLKINHCRFFEYILWNIRNFIIIFKIF